MARCKLLHVIWVAFLLAGTGRALPATTVDDAPAPENINGDARGLSRNSIQTGDDLMDSIYSDCLKKDSVSCVKYKLFSFVDKVLTSKDSFRLTEGVTVVKSGNLPEVSRDGAPRSLGDEVQSHEVEDMVASRVERFLQTHTLKVDLKGDDVLNAVSSAGRALGDVVDSFGLTEDEASSVGEERGKKKKAQKILLPLLLAMKLKAAALIPLALGAIALIAGKALLIGKIALVLAAIIGLKKLLSQQKTVTYEIVSHPHHTGGHESYSSGGGGGGGFGGDIGGGYGSSGSGGGGGGGHGGWGRSLGEVDAHQLAYRGYAQQS
uniref:Osiris 7 n=1 Tax=Timema genevievae TaxID=629358 RepID=A0A7R9PIM7_TIMGE|nr:unnamed protein product [Timema genevievae]